MASETTPLKPSMKDRTTGEPTPAPAETQKGAKPIFSNTFALICSCLSCAVGTGNIWRFPRILAQSAGEDGALCFLLIWVMFLFLWSIPMLIVEYGLGRYTQSGVVQSLNDLFGNKSTWCGSWITTVNFAIGCYYTVILGWCIYYVFQCIAFPLPQTNYESQQIFESFAVESAWPLLTQAIGALLTGALVLKGVSSIEKASVVLGPLLVLFLLFLFIWTLTRPNAATGLAFMFSPDWGSLGNPNVWLDAMSQNAFDTGAGTGIYIAYAAYMSSKNTVVKYACLFPIVNNIVSLFSGMIVVSTVFAAETTANPNVTNAEVLTILRSAGPASTGLTFIGLPVLFGAAGDFGRVGAVIFFLTLFCAALSSNVAFLEAPVRIFVDYGANRFIVVPLITLALFICGLGSALSLDYLANQDATWAYALLVNGLILQGAVIFYGTTPFRKYIINCLNEGKDWAVPYAWEIFIKFILPLEAVIILLWWVVSEITVPPGPGELMWYQFGPTSLISILIQWIGTLAILIGVNALLCKTRPQWFTKAPWKDLQELPESIEQPRLNGDL